MSADDSADWIDPKPSPPDGPDPLPDSIQSVQGFDDELRIYDTNRDGQWIESRVTVDLEEVR